MVNIVYELIAYPCYETQLCNDIKTEVTKVVPAGQTLGL